MRRLLGYSRSWSVRSFALAVLAQVLMACSSGGSDGGDGASSAVVPPSWSGNLAAEHAYAASNGNGTVSFITNVNLNDIGLSSIVDGQRLVEWNPYVASNTPLLVAEWFRYHELGHHFRDHLHLYGGKYAEYEADAFASRVFYHIYGAANLAGIIGYWQASGNPGNFDHRSGVERAAYIQAVLNSISADPITIPTPPTTQLIPITRGTYRIVNLFSSPIIVYINDVAQGYIPSGEGANFHGPPGLYFVRIVDALVPLFQYVGGYYPVILGEVTTVP